MALGSWLVARDSWLVARGSGLVGPNIGDCHGSKVNNVIVVHTQM